MRNDPRNGATAKGWSGKTPTRNIQAMVVDELEKQKLSNANKFAEIEQKNALQQEKIVKLKQYQNEQQLNSVDLQKTIATLREIALAHFGVTKSTDVTTSMGVLSSVESLRLASATSSAAASI
uniref:Uncharacterized protein n=1 Tax=Globodera pallida TaxID=36090 RepID=A0A183BXH5_GLOPA